MQAIQSAPSSSVPPKFFVNTYLAFEIILVYLNSTYKLCVGTGTLITQSIPRLKVNLSMQRQIVSNIYLETYEEALSTGAHSAATDE